MSPQDAIANRVEQRMADVGREWFDLVLASGEVWESVRQQVSDTRVEVETELADALVPWELMRDPMADLPLALEAKVPFRSVARLLISGLNDAAREPFRLES